MSALAAIGVIGGIAILAVIIASILYLALRPRLANNGTLKKIGPKY